MFGKKSTYDLCEKALIDFSKILKNNQLDWISKQQIYEILFKLLNKRKYKISKKSFIDFADILKTLKDGREVYKTQAYEIIFQLLSEYRTCGERHE
jgi:predicted nucleic-acid-binding protein